MRCWSCFSKFWLCSGWQRCRFHSSHWFRRPHNSRRSASPWINWSASSCVLWLDHTRGFLTNCIIYLNLCRDCSLATSEPMHLPLPSSVGSFFLGNVDTLPPSILRLIQHEQPELTGHWRVQTGLKLLSHRPHLDIDWYMISSINFAGYRGSDMWRKGERPHCADIEVRRVSNGSTSLGTDNECITWKW